ncbi:rRNA small subunit methyltransferase G [Musa troglodytarum]|uniref:rRNA small subunit methyltransferase G n=1 Tax=Musa troglodytarum TaxID=320322 RepID=A0A9E7GUC7_9LILI|nr:rRNA small subunit methyltransferase G [Musa troglodytarum]
MVSPACDGRNMEAIIRVAYEAAVRAALAALERNILPDAVVRSLTRLLLAGRLRLCYLPSADLQLAQLLRFKQSLDDMPIAVETDKAKSQHYELPTSFFKLMLGENLKYSPFSCCYFKNIASTLEDAENAMLELYSERAQLKDGQKILDVGCGWGHLQLSNVEIIVADIAKFEMEASFDRVVSIEMFEHMKNYKMLLKKISLWMKQDSLLFIHHFCHKTFAYHFEDKNEDDWITRYFFTGGTMPSANLLLYFQDDVAVLNHWLLNGTHYARTSEEWLKRMDSNLTSIRPIFEATYGMDSATKWIAYWRTFFISVAELFGYNNGDEWMVALLLFKKK